MDGLLPGLEPDERLLSRTPASFRGATAASVRSTFALGSARLRNQAYNAWRMHAESSGFPAAGPEMWLGLTDRRLIVWDTTFILSRPGRIKGVIRLSEVAQVATARHGLVTGLALALTTGQFVEVEAMRGRRLHRFAHALRAALESHRR
jgi:hypothetical protein